MKEILRKLCTEKGISGKENDMFDIIKDLLGTKAGVRKMSNGNIIAEMGDKNSTYHIMIDAHIDRIGLAVTYIDDRGFIKAEPVGGIDLRALPDSAVIVKGSEDILGVVCSMPPHLTKSEEILSRDNIWVDTGLPAEKVKELVSLGDCIIVKSNFRKMLNDKVSVSALDNRAGCAALIGCIEKLSGNDLPCRVSFVFSSQEETNESGAKTAAFELAPDEAVVVDVGFAEQYGVPHEKSGESGCGAIISIAPVLSKKITKRLIDIAHSLGSECDFEVDGGNTGTNADEIAVSCGGIPCGVLSIPEKNMHTQTETVYIGDIEKAAEILFVYISEGGIMNG